MSSCYFFAGLLVGIVLGGITYKYLKIILMGISYVIMCVVIVGRYISTLPIRIISLLKKNFLSRRKIIREYDRIFHQVNSMTEVTRINKKIKKLEQRLAQKIQKRIEKESLRTVKKFI